MNIKEVIFFLGFAIFLGGLAVASFLGAFDKW